MIRALCLWICLALPSLAVAQDRLRMAVTTSFHNSGLADVLLPALREDTGVDIQLLVVGTGQALRLGRSGDVDALLVHARDAEEAFVADGYAPYRREIMFNDFVIVGPESDPAALSDHAQVIDAFRALALQEVTFVSRGDDSGTHQREVSIWARAGFDPDEFGRWYTSVGASMGAALNTSVGLDAYVLTDRASWLNFGNTGDLTIVFEGDPLLFNQYSFLPIAADRHPHVARHTAQNVEDWLTSEKAAALIDGYTIAGQPLFTFNARPR